MGYTIIKGINESEENKFIKVYDPETKKVIYGYSNRRKAGVFLGIPVNQVINSCSKRTRCFSKTLGKDVALRIANKEPGMIFCPLSGNLKNIEFCNKDKK